MRKSVDISDKFDSASETEWIGNHWELAPHTRDISRLLYPAVMGTLIIGLFGTLFYLIQGISDERKWRYGMHELYAPYQSAVVQMEKFEHCEGIYTSWCSERKADLTRQRDEAWKALCAAENSEKYIRELVNGNLPYQACK